MLPASVNSWRSIGLGFDRVVSSITSGVIHRAVQSGRSSKPISQKAGALQGEARPESSHTRTCQ